MLRTFTCCAYPAQIIFFEGLSLLYFFVFFHLQAAQCGKHVLRVSLEDVRTILKKNTSYHRKLVSASCVLSAPVM